MRFPYSAGVAEIGVDDGVFSRSILRTDPSRLHLIDPWKKQTGDYARDGTNEGDFEQKYRAVRETLGRMLSVEIIRDYSLKAAGRFPDSYFDWIYLDADHSYRAVTSDLEAWIRKIRPEASSRGTTTVSTIGFKSNRPWTTFFAPTAGGWIT